MLDVRRLIVEFRGERAPKRAIDGVSLTAGRGETMALIGPAEAGKTVLLRAIAGLETITAGTIAIDGALPTNALRKPNDGSVLPVFTDKPVVWPRATVGENIAVAIEGRGLTNPAVRAQVATVLMKVGLTQAADTPVGQLSRGQEQRLALARILIDEPVLLLLDDSLSSLDPQARAGLRSELKSLGKTILWATHDQEGALASADRVAVMRAGRILECAAPLDLYLRPRHPFTAAFLGQAILLEGRRVARMGESALIETDIGTFIVAEAAHDDASGCLMIRPEFVEIAGIEERASNIVEGIVRGITFAGKLIEYSVQAGTRLLCVQRPATRLYAEGESVRLRLPAERCSFLPRDV